MKYYAILGETNPYIAQRDICFNGKTKVVFKEFDTLEEANRELLKWCMDDYDLCGRWNWGLLKAHGYGVCYKDGTRAYEFDSRWYYTEVMEKEEEATIKTYRTNAVLFVDNIRYYIDWDGMEFETKDEYKDWIEEELAPAKHCDNYQDVRTALEIATNYIEP